MSDPVRIDKWLWATRIYKTRSQATTACRLNQINVNNQPAKPSQPVSPGDIILVEKDLITRTLKVLNTLEKRVGAKLVPQYLEDLTPEEEIARAKERRQQHRANKVFRWPGIGRPTKKDRRDIEKFLDHPP
ncbi:MAG: RNA-binding S4 domain-containing protein [Verrucomicrobiota bacterium]